MHALHKPEAWFLLFYQLSWIFQAATPASRAAGNHCCNSNIKKQSGQRVEKSQVFIPPGRARGNRGFKSTIFNGEIIWWGVCVGSVTKGRSTISHKDWTSEHQGESNRLWERRDWNESQLFHELQFYSAQKCTELYQLAYHQNRE